jgi:hypothetical protein
MILIAHRGNVDGRFEARENEPAYIDEALARGYDVEVDVWYHDRNFYLGHDQPQYGIAFGWFVSRLANLWIHCKNVEAVVFFKDTKHGFNYFWHETDTLTLTSHNYLWVYPGKQPIENSIAVMPEYNNDAVARCLGICSDNITYYEKNII